MVNTETWQLQAQLAAGHEHIPATDHSREWMTGQIGHHIHDPYDRYEKVAS